MAGRTVHYTLGVLLARDLSKAESSRFLLGSLLPDAYEKPEQRDLTHYTARENDLVWFDFSAFFAAFGNEIRTDPLYLGYYLHLVEDDLHRRMIHGRYGDRLTPKNDADVEILYRDYHLLNRYLTDAYGLKNELILPPDFDRLPLNDRVPLDAACMIAALDADLHETATGDPAWVTPEMFETFIADSLPVLRAEMAAARNGRPTLTAKDFAWKRHSRYN